MADGVNMVVLLGNLGADPELRFTQNNQPVLKFRLATSRSWKNDSGELKTDTQWHNVVLWGKRAEGLSKFLTKGSRVHVQGRIETREYEDKDGNKRYITEINAYDLVPCGDAQGGGRRRDDDDRRHGASFRHIDQDLH